MLTLTGKRVLVTGGAGFIGSHLVDRLVKENPDRIVVIDNLFLGNDANLNEAKKSFPNLTIYHDNLADYENTKSIFEKEQIDVVFNLAVIPLPTSLQKPVFTFEENANTVLVVSELLRKKFYQSLIHFSSSEVYGSAEYIPMDENHPLNPCTPYAASKAAGDHLVLSYVKTFGVDAAIVRPFNNFGPRQNRGKYAGIIPIVIQQALQGRPITINGDGCQTRDYIFVKDVADAAVNIFKEEKTRGKILNIASGKEISINDLVKNILRILKLDAKIEYQAVRPGDVQRHFADISLAKKLIGFSPKPDISEGLRETVEWYKNEYQK